MMADVLYFIIGFACVFVGFGIGEAYGRIRALKAADEIIEKYKKAAEEAIDLVNRYVKGGSSDGM